MHVHAHPDDESSKGAASTARYVAEGADVRVVTCTGGERGSILNPNMDRPEVLGQPRRDPPPGDGHAPGRSSVSPRSGWASSTPATPTGTRRPRSPTDASPPRRWRRRPVRWSVRSGSSGRTSSRRTTRTAATRIPTTSCATTSPSRPGRPPAIRTPTPTPANHGSRSSSTTTTRSIASVRTLCTRRCSGAGWSRPMPIGSRTGSPTRPTRRG